MLAGDPGVRGLGEGQLALADLVRPAAPSAGRADAVAEAFGLGDAVGVLGRSVGWLLGEERAATGLVAGDEAAGRGELLQAAAKTSVASRTARTGQAGRRLPCGIAGTTAAY